jgi:hypothetical protein
MGRSTLATLALYYAVLAVALDAHATYAFDSSFHADLNTSRPRSPRSNAEGDQELSREAATGLIVFACLIVGLGVVVLLHWAARPRYAVVVTIEEGVPQVTQGTVEPAIVGAVRDICVRHGVPYGTIWGVNDRNLLRLRFSREFPDACRQQIRNIWAAN